MGELDEIVLGAFEETVLEPKRLHKTTEALVSGRASAMRRSRRVRSNSTASAARLRRR